MMEAILGKPRQTELASRLKEHLAEVIQEHLDEADPIETARALGWTSLAIGLSEAGAPRQVSQLLGIEDTPVARNILRAMGAREIGHGLSILAQTSERPEGLAMALWARVAGDVLDTVLLGLAGTKTRRPVRFAIISAVVMGIGAADLLCATALARKSH